MIADIHSHILYEIDDGPQSLKESVEMIEKAKSIGVTSLCITPHCYTNYESNFFNESKSRINKIRENTDNIEIYSGYEIMIDNNLCDFITQNPGVCIGKGKYILIELTFSNFPLYLKNELFELQIKGFSPIIAHPERNIHIQAHPEILTDRVLPNAHIQVNVKSILGLYGRKIKKTALFMIKNDMVSFIASDAHHVSGYKYMEDCKEFLYKKIGKIKTNQLLHDNPLCAMEGIYVEKPAY